MPEIIFEGNVEDRKSELLELDLAFAQQILAKSPREKKTRLKTNLHTQI